MSATHTGWRTARHAPAGQRIDPAPVKTLREQIALFGDQNPAMAQALGSILRASVRGVSGTELLALYLKLQPDQRMVTGCCGNREVTAALRPGYEWGYPF